MAIARKPRYFEGEITIEPLELGDRRRAMLAELCDRLSFKAAELLTRTRGPTSLLLCTDDRESRVRERLHALCEELDALGVRMRCTRIKSTVLETRDTAELGVAS